VRSVGIDVEHDALGCCGKLPGSGSGESPRITHARKHRAVQTVHAAVRGGVGGDLAEECRLVPQRSEIGKCIPAIGQHHRDVACDTSRLVGHLAAAKGRELLHERSRETDAIGQTGQESGTGTRRETACVTGDFNRKELRGSFHLNGDPFLAGVLPVATRIIPAQRVTVSLFRTVFQVLREKCRLGSPP
jgi:hypothetical protein